MDHSARFRKVFILAISLFTQNGFGWGSDAHQLVNATAVNLLTESLGKTKLGACIQQNKDLLQRYAITPDYEWKMVGRVPKDINLRTKKRWADLQEHDHHYFEPRAYGKDGEIDEAFLMSLMGMSYKDARPLMGQRLVDNDPYMKKNFPDKVLKDSKHASSAEVQAHGDAPFRTEDLYRKAVDALKAGDFATAMFFMGTLGHYVGDMSQPFHASLNFNGQLDPLTTGIHSDYETQMIKEWAKNSGAVVDPRTSLLVKSQQMEKDVLAFVKTPDHRLNAFPDGKATQNLKEEMARLTITGQQYIDPLLAAYKDSHGKDTPAKTRGTGALPEGKVHPEWILFTDEETHEHIDPELDSHHTHKNAAPANAPKDGAPKTDAQPKATAQPKGTETKLKAGEVRTFMDKEITVGSLGKMTVLDTAKKRIGEGSDLLAKIWLSALKEAQIDDSTSCETFIFDQPKTIINYPQAKYLDEIVFKEHGHVVPLESVERQFGRQDGSGNQPNHNEGTPPPPSSNRRRWPAGNRR